MRWGLGATGGGPSTPEERAAWLAGLRQIIDTAEAAFTAVLADFDTAGDGQGLHAAASTTLTARADPADPAYYEHVRTIHCTVRALPSPRCATAQPLI